MAMSGTGMDDNAWTAPRRALWQRLHQYDFGGEQHEAFLTRLARICQTTREGAQAALDEYRRFCFLAVAAGHAVTPSESIDQVWHAHMTDTRDYWQRFCPQVLEQSLHHAPSLGGIEEQARHQRQYRDTYASYQRFFGEPPATQWPRPKLTWEPQAARRPIPEPVRAHPPLRFATPWQAKPRGVGAWPWIWSGACAAVYALAASASGEVNPLQWRGGAFLAFYLSAIVALFCVCGALQRAARGANRRGGDSGDLLADPVALGFLAGGGERAADVAIVELLARDAFSLDYAGSAVDAAARRDPAWLRANAGGEHRVPDSLREAAWIVQRRQGLHEAVGALKQHYAGLAGPLQARGWWLSRAQDWTVRWLGGAPMLLLVGFGLGKIAIGLERGRPVGFLVLLTAIAGLLALIRLGTSQRRSRAGDWALHDAGRELVRRSGSGDGGSYLGGFRAGGAHDGDSRDGGSQHSDTGARVALGGTLALIGTGLADYHHLRTPVPSGDGGSGSSNDSSSGGDSGSCGSSGCGGCGGGGD